MISQRQVTEEEAKEYAEKCSIPYYETSAKLNTNINEAVLFIAKRAYKKVKESNDKKFSLEEMNDNKDNSGCLFKRKKKQQVDQSDKKKDGNKKKKKEKK